jgi:L-aspartate oxidase
MASHDTISLPSIAARHGEAVVIAGAGLAGLFTALKLAPYPVILVSPVPLGEGTSSAWAQGGIAAAICEGDTPQAHAGDTIKAGAGIVDEAMARLLASEAADRIEDLLRLGVPFDRDIKGKLALSREAAHSARRIARVKGDLAGKAIMAAVTQAVRRTPSVHVLEGMSAHSLALDDKRVCGVHLWPTGTYGTGPQETLPAKAVVLATGGVGQLFDVTTNPASAHGEGIALAARAGAVISDPEFVQFHPTALNIGCDPAPLASEALRGEGAKLINGKGERYMTGVHKDAELAPRDVVARATYREVQSGRGAFIDCRDAIGSRFPDAFPGLYEVCKSAGLEPDREPIPIAPAAHYHMGGVLTDANGRTTADGLWACGEVACNGIHGANRLASNSLLETVVFGARVARDISAQLPKLLPPSIENLDWIDANAAVVDLERIPGLAKRLRRLMTGNAGVVRSREDLFAALNEIEHMTEENLPLALSNSLLTARFILAGAVQRKESRGSHFRTDFPESRDAWKRHTYLTLKDVKAITDQVQCKEVAGSNVIRAVFGQ